MFNAIDATLLVSHAGSTAFVANTLNENNAPNELLEYLLDESMM